MFSSNLTNIYLENYSDIIMNVCPKIIFIGFLIILILSLLGIIQTYTRTCNCLKLQPITYLCIILFIVIILAVILSIYNLIDDALI